MKFLTLFATLPVLISIDCKHLPHFFFSGNTTSCLSLDVTPKEFGKLSFNISDTSDISRRYQQNTMTPRLCQKFHDTDLNTAMLQIWSRLPGTYSVWRESHHDQTINGAKYDHRDITIPAMGVSEITARNPTDPDFDGELLQKSTFHLKTYDGNQQTKTEARVFRFKDGKIGIWHVHHDAKFTVSFWLTDVHIPHDIREPYRLPSGLHQEVGLNTSDEPWVDEHGKHHLSFDFVMGGLCHYQVKDLLIKGPDEWTTQKDVYLPLPGGSMAR